MGRATVILKDSTARKTATDWVSKAPAGTVVEFRRSKRTLDQNDRMWAMLTDIAEQVEWEGQKRSTEEWKDLFMDWLPRELRTLPALDGSGRRVVLGRSTSALTKSEMSDLMTLMEMFGANNGVSFRNADG